MKLTYQKIRAASPSVLPRLILIELSRHIGEDNRIPKNELIIKVMGKVTTTTDRQVRDAIADLQTQDYPILSDSGEGGYWIASNNREADSYLAELNSRIARISAKRAGIIRGLNRSFGPPTLF